MNRPFSFRTFLVCQALTIAAMALIARPSAQGGPATTTGIIAYFNSASCPAGWAEFTTARGLYIVGRVSGGTLATTVGTALSNQENRPTGQHTHQLTSFGGGLGDRDDHDGAAGDFNAVDSGAVSGAVAGTNAPYIQLLVCKRN